MFRKIFFRNKTKNKFRKNIDILGILNVNRKLKFL